MYIPNFKKLSHFMQITSIKEEKKIKVGEDVHLSIQKDMEESIIPKWSNSSGCLYTFFMIVNERVDIYEAT